jgi:hypothetical protein
MPEKPVLSVVATSRNDNHGGNALWRTQHFVSGLVAQAEKFQFPIELVLVDWNPPEGKPNLHEALTWPEKSGYFTYRVIEVPPHVHQTFPHGDKLPLFQYIAKNVGIRRAKGDFVLSTNIDILFSDEIMAFMKGHLNENTLYRVDRYDIEDKIQDEWSFEEILAYARTHIIRTSPVVGTSSKKQLKGPLNNFWAAARLFIKNLVLFPRMLWTGEVKKLMTEQELSIKSLFKKIFNYLWYLTKIAMGKGLHTNACGDFTLLSKKDWFKLHGYPEWPQYSWKIDSVLLYQCYYNRIKMHNLPTSHAIYHIEHGSGWTPEGENLLFSRLQEKGIPYMDDRALQKEIENQKMLRKKGVYITYGPKDWGLANVDLVERGSVAC